MNFNFDLDGRNQFDYPSYRTIMTGLIDDGKTTGENQSDDMVGYTKMNGARMNRLDKKSKIDEDLTRIVKELPQQRWIVLTEAWCGDAAQNMPWIYKMTELNPNIKMAIILRDENLDIMDAFLTNGGRSIPKLIALNEENEVLYSWGPRPQSIQTVYAKMKSDGFDYADISKEIHSLYAKDKGVSLQAEFIALLS